MWITCFLFLWYTTFSSLLKKKKIYDVEISYNSIEILSKI